MNYGKIVLWIVRCVGVTVFLYACLGATYYSGALYSPVKVDCPPVIIDFEPANKFVTVGGVEKFVGAGRVFFSFKEETKFHPRFAALVIPFREIPKGTEIKIKQVMYPVTDSRRHPSRFLLVQ